MRRRPGFSLASAIIKFGAVTLRRSNPTPFSEFRKNSLQKRPISAESFAFSDARDDAHHSLTLISVGRFLFGKENLPTLERIFELYRLGGWPCGVKADRRTIVVFDPSVLGNRDDPRG